MFCNKCGAPLEDGAKFCVKCGAQLAQKTKAESENAGQAQKIRPKSEATQQEQRRAAQNNQEAQRRAAQSGQEAQRRAAQSGRQAQRRAAQSGQQSRRVNAERAAAGGSAAGRTARTAAGGASGSRSGGGKPPKKSPLLPILIVVAVIAVAAVVVMALAATGKLDLGSMKFGKTKTEATADASDADDDSSSKKNKKKSEAKDKEENSSEEDSSADSKEDSTEAGSADSKEDSTEASKEESKADSAAASESEKDADKDTDKDTDNKKDTEDSSTASSSSGSNSGISNTGSSGSNPSSSTGSSGNNVSDSAAAAAPAIPEDFDSLGKVLKERIGAELNLVSSDVSDYPTVKLYYSYDDSNGEPITLTDPVTGIKETIEGGKEIERKVRSIQQLEGNQGLSIDIIADKSGSMSSDMTAMQNIMSEFVQNMDFAVGDAAELIAFDSYIMYMCTYTKDPALLENGISNMTASGDTALYDAIMAGITNASYQQGARCVIAFTDGEDNRSNHTPEEIVNAAVTKDVPVYIIGMGGANSGTLSDICSRTGGAYWNIHNINDMSEVMDEIYSNQKSMYCIEYESDKNADPYAKRTVSCILSDEDLNGTESSDTFTPTEALKQEHHASRYELVKADVSWTEANDLAIAKGGHLVTITSADEQKEVSKMAEEAGLKYIWIGGYTSVRNNVAYGHWVTGEYFDNYTAWYPGEPSRTDTMDNEPEFYIMLWNVEGEWSWNDQRNVLAGDPDLPWFTGNMGYVIEYEY